MEFICRKPGKKSVNIIRRDDKLISRSVTREYSFVIKKTKGCHVWDEDGKKYLDFAAGVAVANVGHTNPEVVKAVINQAPKGTHAAFADFYAELPVKFAEKLVSLMDPFFNNVFLSNSGTESVEAAYKCARWHTKRKWTIAFKHAFHGRTMGSLSMTNSKPVQRERYAPFLPVEHALFADPYRMGEDATNISLNSLETLLKKHKGDVASVFLEPIQGEGGYIVPPRDFIRGVRKLCNEHNTLLCDDEVQAGCFRTGTFTAIENFGVRADIISMSKAIGGGLPLGATVSNKKIMDWPHGSHANTFGGNLLACAAGLAALNYAQKKRLGKNAKAVGKLMLKRLEEMKDRYEIVGDVRGIGLMIGVEIVTNKRSKAYGIKEREKILCESSKNGLILLGAGKSVIRICPPLIITKQQAMHGLDILENAVKAANNKNK